MNYRIDKKYNIDPLRQRELFYFCRQYPKWQAALLNMAELKAVNNYGQPHGSGISDPTGNAAARRERLTAKVWLVESAAKDAGGDIWQAVLFGAIHGLSFDELKRLGLVAAERDMYYQKRRIFYWLLDRRLEE